MHNFRLVVLFFSTRELIMKYAGGSCPSRAGRLSKADVAGVKSGLCRAAAAVALMGCLGAPTAFADAPAANGLPGATVSGYFYDSYNNGVEGLPTEITGAGAYKLNDYFTSNGGGTWADGLCSPPSANCMFDSVSDRADVQMTPFPSLSMSVSQLSSIPNGGSWTQGYAMLSYDIEINGPSPDVLLDVSGWTAVNGPFQAGQALVNIGGAPTGYGTQSGDGTPVPYSALLWEPTGVPIGVQLYIYAYVGNGLPFESPTPTPTFDSTSAYVDPYFSIDPSNADPGAYSILTSPGIGDSPSTGVAGTPEPSTWAMMLLGFAGLALGGYRRAKAARAILAA
jgi:PEP-CTERM motif